MGNYIMRLAFCAAARAVQFMYGGLEKPKCRCGIAFRTSLCGDCGPILCLVTLLFVSAAKQTLQNFDYTKWPPACFCNRF